MKILYAIQGTGNGHLSRARDIIPILSKKGKLDLVVSGTQADVNLPYEIKYRFRGMSFIFGKNGGVDIWKTIRVTRPVTILKEIYSLPVQEYDIVIHDFEPITAWACRIRKKHCVALSHQAALRFPESPKPKRIDPIGWTVLKFYAPANSYYGFHFHSYHENIFTPVIGSEIRNLQPTNDGHYTVYLPSYDDNRILDFLSNFPEVKWEVFSKHNQKPIQVKNIRIQRIENESFIRSMESSEGVFCGAGFETPAEAMYLGKKLLVIPMRKQYEQYCNAKALEEMGVGVIYSLSFASIPIVRNWIQNSDVQKIQFPDSTERLLDFILSKERNA